MSQSNASKCLLFVLAFGSFGCVQTVESGVSLNDTVHEDSAYKKALDKETRSKDVIDDFETRYKIRATHFSPDFRAAFVDRLKRILLQNEPGLALPEGKVNFFVSIFTPERGKDDLNNPNYWTILLKTPQGDVKPASVRKINDKTRWSPFFDYVNDWSNEYFIEFDSPQGQDAQMVAPNNVQVTFANADARVVLTW